MSDVIGELERWLDSYGWASLDVLSGLGEEKFKITPNIFYYNVLKGIAEGVFTLKMGWELEKENEGELFESDEPYLVNAM